MIDVTTMLPEDVIQTERGDTFRFTKACHPPVHVFVPVESEFTVEECGNYRKLRFATGLPEGAEDAEGIEIVVGAETQKVFTVDVKTQLRQILRMKRDPSVVCVYWTSPWKEAELGVYERSLNAWGTLMRLIAVVQEKDVKHKARDVQQVVEEHLRGAAKDKLLAKLTWFDALAPSENGETRVNVTVTIENV